MSIAIGKMLDQSGYLQDLREERSEDGEARIENLAELVSAAREYESREPEPSLGGFVDRLSLLSDVDEEQGTRDARVWMMTLHSAKGLEFPVVILAGLEEGLFPHSRSSEDEEELEEERRLCYVGMTRARRAAGADRRGAPAHLRRIPVERAVAFHRRSAGGARRARRCRPSRRRRTRETSPHYEFRTNPYGRGGAAARRAKSRRPTRTRTRISRPAWRCGSGMRVRHPQFGVGTVLSVEALADDTKLVVRFAPRTEDAAGEVRAARARLIDAGLRRSTNAGLRLLRRS